MSKAPAFQFYVKDWLADVELQAASASTRGVWINALCLMWESRTRGTISGHTPVMPRRLNCTVEEFDLFLAEAATLKFADVTICNGEVTVTNRRMRNEEKVREDTRLRVQRHRCNAASNADVTPPSSSPTPTPSTKVLPRDTPSTEGVLPSEPTATEDASSSVKPEMGNLTPQGQGEQPAQPKPKAADGDPKRTQDKTPHQAIVALYHEILPMCPQVKVWNPEQKSRLRTRWNEDKNRQSLDWWRWFFQRVAASDWLTGRVKDFVCDLDWLVGPKNMAKVLNGRFDNRGPRTGSRQADRNALAAQAFVQGE